jgi:uncharacterized protein
LAWPNHEHHTIAHDSFAAHAMQGWATCPITECGFVRVSANAKIIPDAVAPRDAIELLSQMSRHPHHVFWSADLRLNDSRFVPRDRIKGHRQITDAYLIALALRHGGQLATLDQGIASLVVDKPLHEVLTIIPGVST